VSALRFLFIKTLHRHFLAEHIPFPKSCKRLPTVLSPEEVARLIDSARNLYHRTLLMTLYSTAMRRAELCRLKVHDVDSSHDPGTAALLHHMPNIDFQFGGIKRVQSCGHGQRPSCARLDGRGRPSLRNPGRGRTPSPHKRAHRSTAITATHSAKPEFFFWKVRNRETIALPAYCKTRLPWITVTISTSSCCNL